MTSDKIRFRVRWGRDDSLRPKDSKRSRKHLLGHFTAEEIKKLDSMLNIANYYMDVKLYYVGRKGAST